MMDMNTVQYEVLRGVLRELESDDLEHLGMRQAIDSVVRRFELDPEQKFEIMKEMMIRRVG